MDLELMRFANSLRTVALLLGLPSVAAANPAVRSPIIAPSTALTGLGASNNVACVYDRMSIEDREMALLLFEREVASGVKIHNGSRNLKVIERLVDEARVKCSSPYRWSNAQTEVATAYAMNELMSVGVTQALEAQGHSPGTIDAYYTRHRAELVGLEKIEGAKAHDFEAYLVEHGWAKGETTTLMTAQFYLEALLTRDHQAQTFSAASARPAAVPKAKTSRLRDRARTARRGKP